MNPRELIKMAQKQEKLGLDHVVLTMPSPQPSLRRSYPLRRRTPFGLCRWYPSADSSRIIIFVKIKQLKKYFESIGASDQIAEMRKK